MPGVVPARVSAKVLILSSCRLCPPRGMRGRSPVSRCLTPCSSRAGVLVGLLAMGESLPSGLSMKLLRFLSWVVTMLGVSALANGKGEHVLCSIARPPPPKPPGKPHMRALATRRATTPPSAPLPAHSSSRTVTTHGAAWLGGRPSTRRLLYLKVGESKNGHGPRLCGPRNWASIAPTLVHRYGRHYHE